MKAWGTVTEQETPTGAAEEIARLKAQVATLSATAAEREDAWRRAMADLDNMRKRSAREAETQRGDERAQVAARWLPVLDNLDLALSHADADPATIVAGVRAVRDQALDVLAGLGYPRRADLGARFDPVVHEAVAAVRDPQQPTGTVLQVVRPGYGDDTRPLRPAAVVVATGDQ